MQLLLSIFFLTSFLDEGQPQSLKEVKELDISLQDILADLSREEAAIQGEQEMQVPVEVLEEDSGS